jgi:GTP-binding protein HflX
MRKTPIPTIIPRERAFLVGVDLDSSEHLWSLDDSLRELALLAGTAGLAVVGQTSQHLKRPDVKTYIGSGKVEEVRALASEQAADVILFDDELNPRHQRELEEAFGDEFRVLDRTALILDVFALHAATHEGALQVELAQYEYRLPRLTRAWTHLARQAGGGGGRAGRAGGVGLRGPGETQLEVDRREIRRRIARLKEELENVRAHRKRHRMRRKRAEMPTVVLVGYTNAGKSTLLNAVANADVLVADRLFATLDPTTRRVLLPGGRAFLLTDTVGFIQKLPTTLVAAFRATLEEIGEADLLLHVVDITHRNAGEQAQAVQETLQAIGATGVPMLAALNKVDLLADRTMVEEMARELSPAVAVSALRGDGIQALLRCVEQELFEKMVPLQALIPYGEGGLISLFHAQGVVTRFENREHGQFIEGRVPARLLHRFSAHIEKQGVAKFME